MMSTQKLQSTMFSHLKLGNRTLVNSYFCSYTRIYSVPRTDHSKKQLSTFKCNGINLVSSEDPPYVYLHGSTKTRNAFCIKSIQSNMLTGVITPSILVRSIFDTGCCSNIRQFSSSSNVTNEVVNKVPGLLFYFDFIQSLAESPGVQYAQNGLIWFHTTTGLPWWATIVLSTIIARATLTLPLAAYQNYIFAKVHNLKPEMDQLVKQLKWETICAMRTYNWPEQYARAMYNRSMKKQWNGLIVRENCHPMKGFILVIAQVPLWVMYSLSIRNMVTMAPTYDANAQAIFLELTTGGFLWFSNLVQADQYWIIPVLYGILNLTNIEIHRITREKAPTRIHNYTTNFFRLVALALVPIAAYVPSCLSLYWTTSSAFGVFQNLLLLSPRFRRLASIPETSTEIKHPYALLWAKTKGVLEIARKTTSPMKT